MGMDDNKVAGLGMSMAAILRELNQKKTEAKKEAKGPMELLLVNNSDGSAHPRLSDAVTAAVSGDLIKIVNNSPTDHHNDDADSTIHAGVTLASGVSINGDAHWRGSEAPYTYYVENWDGTTSYGTALTLNDDCQVGPFQARNSLINIDAVGKHDVVIQETCIRWAKLDPTGDNGIGMYLPNSANAELSDLKVFENAGNGIVATGAQDLSLTNSTLAFNGHLDGATPLGFALDGVGARAVIRDNWFHDNVKGSIRTDFGGGEWQLIADNYFQNELYGIIADAHSYATIVNNTFNSCDIAVSAWADAEPNLGEFEWGVMGRNWFMSTNRVNYDNPVYVLGRMEGNAFGPFDSTPIDEGLMWVTDPLANAEDNFAVADYASSIKEAYIPLIQATITGHGSATEGIADFQPFMLPPLAGRTDLPYYFWFGYETPTVDVTSGTTRIVVRDLTYDDVEEPKTAFLGQDGGVERIVKASFHETDPEERDVVVEMYLRPGGLHLTTTGSTPRDVLYDPIDNYDGGYRTNVNKVIDKIDEVLLAGGLTGDQEQALRVLNEYLHNIYRETTTGIEEDGRAPMKPATAAIDKVYPNPSNPSFSVEYRLQKAAGNVKIGIFNVTGQQVALIDEGAKGMGVHVYSLEQASQQLPSGVYAIKLVVDGQTQGTSKVTLLK